MNRRGFLRLLVGGAAAAVAPTKTFAFFGNILRKPEPSWDASDLAIMSAWKESDEKIAKFLEAMQEQVCIQLFYGSGPGSPPLEFEGLKPRYSSIVAYRE